MTHRAALCALALAGAPSPPAIGAETMRPPELETTLSAGIDSNPAQRTDGPGLGFVQLATGLLQPLPAGLGLEGNFWLRDYAGDNDSGRLDISGLFSQALSNARLDLWATASWYRDRLVRADERNETAIGGLYRRALSARLDLALLAERRWLSYRHASLPWAGRPGGAALGLQGQGAGGPGPRIDLGTEPDCLPGCTPGQTGQTGHANAGHNGGDNGIGAQPRHDRLDQLGLETSWFATAEISLTLGLEAAWRHSSIRLERMQQLGTRAALTFDANPDWTITTEAGWSRSDYPYAPRGLERRDHRRWARLDLRRWLPKGAFYCTLDVLDGRSTIAAEAFTQWVSACGWQHRFQ